MAANFVSEKHKNRKPSFNNVGIRTSDQENMTPKKRSTSNSSTTAGSSIDMDELPGAMIPKKRRRSSNSKSRIVDEESTKEVKSRISAKECRARKKLRYQYLEQLIKTSENVVFQLRKELQQLEDLCIQSDKENGFILDE